MKVKIRRPKLELAPHAKAEPKMGVPAHVKKAHKADMKKKAKVVKDKEKYQLDHMAGY
jgi:hypothetical protein